MGMESPGRQRSTPGPMRQAPDKESLGTGAATPEATPSLADVEKIANNQENDTLVFLERARNPDIMRQRANLEYKC